MKIARWITALLVFPLAARAASLEECLAAALENNPGLQATSFRVAAARAAHAQARSAWHPRLTATGRYALTDNPPQAFMMTMNQRVLDMADPAFNPNEPGTTDQLRLGLGLQYRLFDGGRRGTASRMAGAAAESAGWAEEAARNELVFEVTRGYYETLQANAFLAVQDDTVASLDESLRIARERLKAGAVIQTDVLHLEVQRAQAREDRIRARHGLELALAVLNTAIGQDLARADAVDEPTEVDLPAPLATAPATPERRPELEAARQRVRLEEQRVRQARAAYAPVIHAFGSTDWDSDGSSDFERSYLAGVAMEWDIFDGFRRSTGLAEARARLDEAQALLVQIRRQLQLDLTQAVLQEVGALERLGVTETAVESAEESLRITRERYEQGAAGITELLNAQVGLTATRMRRAASYYEYWTARANVERAGGGAPRAGE